MTVFRVPSNLTRLPFELGLEPLAREHHAGLDQLLVELPHLGQELLARHHARLGVLVCLDHHHESHRFIPPRVGYRALELQKRRTGFREIDSQAGMLASRAGWFYP